MSYPTVYDKLDKLKDILRRMGRVVVAFSGGVDSAFLVRAACSALGGGITAVTVKTQAVSWDEVDRAGRFCRSEGIEHIIIDKDILSNGYIRSNPADRCYHCKKEMFSSVFALAEEKGADHVCDGSNSDDAVAHRPGRKALEEMGVRSPLSEASLTKEEIRAVSREIGLRTWNIPSESCMLTRFPYGREITETDIRKARAGERTLLDMGFRNVRVRVYGDLARIEVAPEDIPEISSEKSRKKAIGSLKNAGFTYVTLDLEGYRSGSMDEDGGVE